MHASSRTPKNEGQLEKHQSIDNRKTCRIIDNIIEYIAFGFTQIKQILRILLGGKFSPTENNVSIIQNFVKKNRSIYKVLDNSKICIN